MFDWNTIKKPFFVLAPMADVTDRAYRTMVARYSRMGQSDGGPAVLWTEFVSCDGLVSRGREQLLRDLQYGEHERPIVAQIFGSNPDNCRQVARLVAELGFDGVDINMGCPDKTINKQGAGACLIQTPDIARQIIMAVRAGVAQSGRNIPISVKTRLGWSRTDEAEEWIAGILDAGVDALTIHARTRAEMSDYPPHWDVFARMVALARAYPTVIIANGEMKTPADADRVIAQTGCDGVMIGKGTFGTPWWFDMNRTWNMVTPQERIRLAIEHTHLYDQLVACDIGPDTNNPNLVFGGMQIPATEHIRGKSFAIMRKNYKAYITGWDGAKDLRAQLMEAETAQQAIAVLTKSLG